MGHRSLFPLGDKPQSAFMNERAKTSGTSTKVTSELTSRPPITVIPRAFQISDPLSF